MKIRDHVQIVSDNIRKFRTQHKPALTRQKLATIAGISYQAVIDLEQGKYPGFRYQTLVKIANALGKPVERMVRR